MTVPALLTSRWESRKLFGDASHSCVVRVRKIDITRLYQTFALLATSPDSSETLPSIYNSSHNASPWQSQLVPSGDWITLQNIQSVSWTRDFTQSSGELKVVIDNIAFNEQSGEAGFYHSMDRGWFSPTRGATVPGRETLWEPTAWTDVFNSGYQIDVWEGYGQELDITPGLDTGTQVWSAPAAARTFVGIIEDCDMESNPDHITLTCHDFSVLWTDQRAMGQNKAKEIKSPITFANRAKTLGETKEYGTPSSSSGAITTDSRLGAQWDSAVHPDGTATEWIEITLPAGHYEDFYVDVAFTGLDMYVSLNAQGGSCKMDGSTLSDGWVDLTLGTVPGDTIPYIYTHADVFAAPSRRWSLGGHAFDLGDSSVLRLSFTNLQPDPSVTSGDTYRAGTDAFYAFRYNSSAPAATNADGWVLTDDAADVVRMVLVWCGFKEMAVEDFGWNLAGPLQFGQDQFFVDIVNEILAQGNYVFFMDAPTGHDLSLGVPVFQPQHATSAAPDGMLEIHDDGPLEAVIPKYDYSNAPYVIRVRGDVDPAGVTLFEDLVKRFMGTYWPPWSGHDYTNLQGGGFTGSYPASRLGGVRRQFSHTDAAGTAVGLGSVAECLFACILIAIQYALQIATGQIQMPGYPGITLDQQIGVVDASTGTNTRLYVASVQSAHNMGPNGSWHMTIGGSLLDTEDMALIAEDYAYTYQRYVLYKAGV